MRKELEILLPFLMDSETNNKEETIELFAKSELPNSFFVQQFAENSSYAHKKYWESYAKIISRRGLPAVNDIKKEILCWWKDANYPGFWTIREFVLKNGNCFWEETKQALISAYEQKDIGWFKWLIELLVMDIAPNLCKENIDKLNEMLDYLEDDDWKEFSKIYQKDLYEIV